MGARCGARAREAEESEHLKSDAENRRSTKSFFFLVCTGRASPGSAHPDAAFHGGGLQLQLGQSNVLPPRHGGATLAQQPCGSR